jgi:LPXTG-motif cell wall-anchored protein
VETLPATGEDTGLLAGIGLVLLLGGLTTLGLTRRRRTD